MKSFHKTPRMLEVEHNLGEPVEQYLRRRYVDDNINLYDLADELGIAYRILLQWLDKAGIYSRRLGICQNKMHSNQ